MRQDIDIPALMRHALAGGYTTASLGKAVGLSQPSVSRLARGVTKPPKAMAVAVRLVRLVGGQVTLPELIGTEGAPTIPQEVRDAA